MEQNQHSSNHKKDQSWYGELVIPVIILVFVIAYWVQTSGVDFISLIFPGILSVIIVILSGYVLIKSRTIHQKESSQVQTTEPVEEDSNIAKPSKALLIKIVAFVGITLVASLLFTTLGALVTMFLLVLSTLLLLGVRRIMTLILFPLIFVLCIYLIFVKLFDFYFPPGILG